MYERWEKHELRRLEMQATLDRERSSKERNELGQFATPAGLANEIARYALSFHDATEIDFLEPSCGSGAFFSALLMQQNEKTIRSALGVEIDPRFADAARNIWSNEGLNVVQGSYTDLRTVPDYQASLLLANPPYVRHHHLSVTEKKKLGNLALAQLGIKPSGLAGLYLYFIFLSHRLLAPGAISAWLVPTEFMDVNYGIALKQYLKGNVQLLRVHQYDASEVQFNDALVTSTVLFFKNEKPLRDSSATFSFGGSLSDPKLEHKIPVDNLEPAIKWSKYMNGSRAQVPTSGLVLSDFFRIRRGLATGSNNFFILKRTEAIRRGIDEGFLRPILPSPRGLDANVIESDDSGWPLIPDQLALIDCSLQLSELRVKNPALAEYLDSADEKITSGYLVSRRNPWYKQEDRDPAPILLSYMGRSKDDGQPLRFILNRSNAVVTNMYLMLYPTARFRDYLANDPDGTSKVHQALLSISANALREGGRVYGGGLHKMEPKELAALPADDIVKLAPEVLGDFQQLPLGLDHQIEFPYSEIQSKVPASHGQTEAGHRGPFQHRLELGCVTALSGGQNQSEHGLARFDIKVDLCGSVAARAAQGVVGRFALDQAMPGSGRGPVDANVGGAGPTVQVRAPALSSRAKISSQGWKSDHTVGQGT